MLIIIQRKNFINSFIKKLPAIPLLIFLLLSSNIIFAQIKIVNTANVSTIDVGKPFVYTLQISCPSGSGPCNNVTITDPLPNNLEFLGTRNKTGNIQNVSFNSALNSLSLQMNPVLSGTLDQIQIVVAFKPYTFSNTVATNIAYGGPSNTLPSNSVNVTATNGLSPLSYSENIFTSKFGIQEGSNGNGTSYSFIWGNRSLTNGITGLSIVETLPTDFRFKAIRPVQYTHASGINYEISYKTNLNSSWTLMGSTYSLASSYLIDTTSFALSASEYVTELKFDYLQTIPGGGLFYSNITGGIEATVYGNIVNTANLGDSLINCINATGTIGGVAKNSSSCDTIIVSNPDLAILHDNQILFPISGYMPGDTITFRLTNGIAHPSGGDLVNPVIIDLLPSQVSYLSHTVAIGQNDPFNGANITPTFTKVDNYLSSGQTFLKWAYNSNILKPNNAQDRSVIIQVKATVNSNAISGSYKNLSYTSNDSLGVVQSYNLAGSTNPFPNNYLHYLDNTNLNGVNGSSDSLYAAARDFNIISPCALAAASSISDSVCANSSIQLQGIGGGTYSWSGPNSFSSSLQNPIIASATATMSGIYTLTVTGLNCTSTATTNIVVNALPTISISKTDATCSTSNNGTAIVNHLTGSSPYTYSWNTSPVQNTITANNLPPGTYNVNVTDSKGCSITSSVIIGFTPNVSSPIFTLGASSTRCQGAGTSPYTATAANSTGIVYSLDATSLGAGLGINSSTGTVSFIAGWTGTSTVTATATGCNGPQISAHTITTTPSVSLPVFGIGATSTRCQGAGNVVYSATSTNATGIVYSLDASSLGAGLNINSSTGSVTYTVGWSGTSIVTATASGCNGPQISTHTITTTPTVGLPVFGLGATSTRCQGAGNVVYSATSTNSTGIVYSLDATSLGAGLTINSSTGSVTYTAGWSGTTTITASASGCNGPRTSTHVITTVTSIGVPVFGLGATSIRCQAAGTVTYSATSSGATGIVYSLDASSISAGNTINSSTGAVTFTAGWSGSSTVTATASGCNGPTTANHIITITPLVGTPVFILGASTTRCQGIGNVVYTANATNTTGITYSLNAASLSAGNTINASTGEVSFVAGWSGISTVTASAAGCGGPRTINHTITTTPTVGTPIFSLGASSSRCQLAGSVTYTATATNSTSLSYSLDATSLGAGITINSSTGQVTYLAGWVGTSVITVTATGCNGPSTSSHTVTINANVVTPVFALGTSSIRCQGAGTSTYSATATNATSISYSLNAASLTGGNTINATTGVVTWASGWSGTSVITATAQGCAGPVSSTHTVTITPTVGTPVFALGSSSTRCQEANSVIYTANATNNTGITYSLNAASLTAGNTIDSSTGEVTYQSGWFGTSIITATATGCNGPRTATHTVTTTASVGTPIFSLGSSSVRCQGNANIIYSATASNSTSIVYTLDAASLLAGNTINSANGRVNYTNTWVGTSVITATATGCNSTAQATHTVTSNASVEIPIFNIGSTSIRCQGVQTLNYGATATNSTSITYSLNAASLSGGNTINSSTGDVTFTAGWTGTSTITATANGCNGPRTATHVVTITPSVGTPVFALGASSVRCQGASSIFYTASASNNTGITYELDVTSILGGNTINSITGEVTYSNTWFGVSQITVTATGCNGPKISIHTVTTNQPVQAPIFALGLSSIRCQGAGSVFYAATALNSNTITYTLDATSISAGNTINSVTGTVTFVAGWSGSSIVTANATGCSGPLSSTHSIVTTPTVGTPIFSLGNSSTRCIGIETVTYTATSTNFTSLTYSLDAISLGAGNSINSTTGAVTFDASWYGVSIITVTVTGCNGPKSVNHTVTTNRAVETPVFTLGSSSIRCQGANSTLYTATANFSTTRVYTLDAASLSAGNTINSSTGNVTYLASWTGPSIITVTASGCYGPTTETHTVTTTPSVTTPIFDLGATSIRCQGAGNVTYNATASYNTSLTYTLDALSLAGGNTIDANSGVVTFSAAWNGTSRVTAIVTGCSGPKSTIHTITVTPTVGFPVFSLGLNSVRCQGANTIIYNATSTNSTGISYFLDATSLSFGNSINPATGAITFLSTWTGISIVTATATGCNGPRQTSHTINTIYISAQNENAVGSQGSPIIVPVLANDLGDLDPTRVSIVTQPNNGFIQIGSNGEITYLPNGNYYGVDQFTYSVCSTASPSCCSQATVFLQIDESLNDPCSEATKSKTYYLPFPENTNFVRKALWSAGGGNFLTDSIRTVLSIKIPYPGNIITYDHWEDGYESNISIPTQVSTEVWGDGITSNGWAPGYPNDIIPAGGYILIDNHFRYNSRDASKIFFDGKDKILSSNDIAISKITGDAGFAAGSNNFDVQNIKSNVFDISRFGKFFVIPFGEDNTLGSTAAFKYTGIFARASENNTIINLDYDANGTIDASSPILNEGDVWFYDGTASTPGTATDINNLNDIKSGAIITSTNNFGVDLVFGSIDNYGTRNIALLPGNFYGDTYFSPAHTTLSTAPVYAFFTNNLSTPITIDWNSGTTNSGSFVIAAKGFGYLDLNLTSAYKFKSRNGEAFTAAAVFDADADGRSFDWSFNMIPENRLSTFASVAWAPGSSNGSANYNPVWVTAPSATTLYIKYDGNLSSKTATQSPCGISYDIAVPITALQSYKIFDPDNDQTGLAVFTCDGTKIAAIWGQDPSIATPGSPGMDVGYVMEPRCLQQLIIANDDISDTEPNTPRIIEVYTNDYGFLCTPDLTSLTNLGLLQPSNGSVVLNNDGTITYTPNNGFQGSDDFEYRVCSVEYPSICDVALVTVRITPCIASTNENLFRGKVFVESQPDDATYNNEIGAAGIQVDLYIDANCNGVIDFGEGITASTVSDIAGLYSFSTKDGNNARDDFEPTASFSGNDGGLNWNNSWTESGDDGNLNSGDVRIMPDPAVGAMGNAIRLSGSVNGINRALSFNNTLSALLKFSYRRQGLDRQGESVNVLINGTTVFVINDGSAVGTDINYTNVYLPISTYNANGVNTLQFVTNGSVSADDFFYIDNIELSFYKNPPICYVAKVNTAFTGGKYTPALLNTQTATFNVLGVCDKDNYLGVLPSLIVTDDNAFATIDQPTTIEVLKNDIFGKPDTNTVSFSGVSVFPSNGAVSLNSNGTINYTPNQGFTGTDQFEYRVCSLEDPLLCDIGLVTITVSCASSPLVNEISGTVYIDQNNNGVFNIGESGLQNTSLNLISDVNNNGVLDFGEPTIDNEITDSTGYYSFQINPPTSSLSYLDQFNFNVIANQSNGTSTWTNSWTKIGDIGTFGQNNIQISNITGLGIQSSPGLISGAFRSVNLTNALSANLSFNYNEQNLDLEVNDYVDLQIASTTSPSSWTLLKRFTGADGNQSGTMTFDISDYISPTTTLRFVTSGSSLMGLGDIVYFDNVRVDYLMPQAKRYIVQLAQPIPVGYSLTNPSPSPTGYYGVAFTKSGDGSCSNNFGLAVTDLEVLKSVDILNPFVGDTVTFTVQARNFGPTNASNVIVTDVLPNGYELIGVNATRGAWVNTQWLIGNLVNGGIETINISARVISPGAYLNTATVIGDQPEANLINNTSSAAASPIPLVDLSLTNSISNPTPNVGNIVTFTVNLTNADLSAATGIVVKNTIPNGYTNISNISNGGVLVGNEITWNLVSLANGANQNLTYQAQVVPPLVGTNYTTIAEVIAANEQDVDSSPNNNLLIEDDQASADAIPQVADLSLNTTINNVLPNVGQVVTFTVNVLNSGIDNATNVQIRNVVDNGFTSITNISNGGVLVGNTITWTIPNISNGSNMSFTYDATVSAPGPGVGHTNIAQVSAVNQYDPDSSPNNNITTEDDQDSITASLQGANLSLIKQISDIRPNVGDTVTFTLSLHNAGPDLATNIGIEDIVPNGYSAISNISNLGSLSGSVINWMIPSLANGSTLVISYQAKVEAPTGGKSYNNVAQIVASDQFDPNSVPNNDISTEDDQSSVSSIPRVADLKLFKEVNNLSPITGDTLTFSIKIKNFGPDTANNIVIGDIIPNGFTNIRNISNGGVLSGSTINWNVSNIPNLDSLVFTYDVSVLAPIVGNNYTNIAQVIDVDEFDLNSIPNNNNSSEDDQSQVTVVPQRADLSLIKSINNLNPQIGSTVTFTIVIKNSGPNNSENIHVKDVIPNGYSNITSISNSGVFNGDSIYWAIPFIANADSVIFTYQAQVETPGIGISHTNIAQIVKVDQFDPDSSPNNNNALEDDQSQVTPMPQRANLSISKTVNNPNPNSGDTVTFTIALNNSGPNTATNITLEDILPNGYSAITNISGGGTLVGSNIEWFINSLNSGSGLTFTYDAMVQPPTVGINFANIVQVKSVDQFDPNSIPGNNNPLEDDQASAFVTPNVSDLSLVKSISNPTPNVGEIITFSLTIHNNGPNLATNVEVEDMIPNGYSNISNISNSGLQSGSKINWNNLTLPINTDLILTYQARVNAPLVGVNYTNIAQIIGSDQYDPNSEPANDIPTEDDQSSVTPTVQQANLSLVKTVNNPTPNVGEVVTFTINVSNAGPDAATNVSLKDVVPNGYTNITNITDGGINTSGTINWTVTSIASGTNISITYQATVVAPAVGINYANVAQISAVDQFDPNSTPNNDNPAEDDQSSVTPTVQQANLSLVKTVNNPTPNVGEVVTFTINVSNAGPDAATNVSLKDVVPNGYTNITNITDGGINTSGTINWTVTSIASGTNISITYQATVVAPSVGINYANVAQISAVDQFDPNSTPNNDNPAEDDQSSVTPTVQQANLSLVKTVNNPTPNVGEVVTFTINLSNAGPDAATNVSLKDVVPNGYTNITNITDGGINTSGTINWTVTSIASGTNISITYQATVVAPAVGINYANVAQISAVDQFDPNSTPNNDNPAEDDQSSVTPTVQQANLSLVKTVNNPTPNVGEVVTFTINVSNAGPDAATNVSLKDVVPNGYTNITNITDGGINTSGTINWTVTSIASGTNISITYQATVVAPSVGINYANVAQISAVDQFDPNSTPNNDNPAEDDQSSVTPTVQQANLSLVKTVNNPTPNVGEVVTFTINLSNAGPDAATNVSLKDVVPNGYTNITNITDGGINTSGTINWTVTSIASGINISITYQATVVAPALGINYANVAQISAVDQFDSNSTPNNDNPAEDDQSSVTPTVQQANLSLVKTVNNPTPNVGEVVTFTINVSNAGPDAATNVSLKDVVPNGYTNITNITDGGINTSGTINWTVTSIASGTNISITYQATVVAPAVGINYANVAQISAVDQFDPNSTPNNDNPAEDDQSSVTPTVQQANLSLVKTVNNPTPNVGEVVTFTINVSNAGPDAATNVSLKDVVPNGYTNITNITDGGINTSGTINWTVTSIASGTNISITYQATVVAPSVGINYANVAQISAVDQFDPNSTPNNDNPAEDDQSSVTPTVQQANLSLVKTVDNKNPIVGSTVTFHVKIFNSGPNTASNIIIEDIIPNGYGSITSISNSGILFGDSLVWSIPLLANGDSIDLSYTAEVKAPILGTNYLNVVQVVGVDQFDPNSTPNNDSPSEDDYATESIIMDNTVPVADAGLDFVKTCSINTSGKMIGDTTEIGYTYSWFPATGLSASNISNPIANPLVTTTYIVTKTNNLNGFTDTDSVIVTVDTTAANGYLLEITPSQTSGPNPLNNGQVKVVSTINTNHTYLISNGNFFNSSNLFDAVLKNIPIGGILTNSLPFVNINTEYTIRIFNTNGCYTDYVIVLNAGQLNCKPEVCVPIVITKTKSAK